MKRILIGLLFVAVASMAAQEVKKTDTAPKKPQVQKLFILKYADPNELRVLLGVFEGSIRPNADMHALAVEAPAESMRAIEDAIQKLDVPAAMPKNIEMMVYLVLATDEASPVGSAVPKDLETVMAQLKNTFSFKNYGLLDNLNFRTRTGQTFSTTSAGGSFDVGSGRRLPVVSTLRIGSITVANDGATIRIDHFISNHKVPPPPGGGSFQDLGIQTDLDIKAGQKVVVGRMGISHDQALFLIMTANIL